MKIKRIFAPEYLEAAARLYGAIPMEEIWKIYNSQNKPVDFRGFLIEGNAYFYGPVSYALVRDKDFMGGQGSYPVDRVDVVEKSAVDCLWDPYLDLLEYHRDMPLRVFEKEEYLAYSQPDYIPDTPQNRGLRAFLENRSDSCTGLDLTREAVRQAEQDASGAQCLQELQRMGARFGDLADRKDFLKVYRQVYDTSPKAIHYGHTEQELRGLPVPELRKRQRIRAWWCAPSLKEHFHTDDKALMQDAPFEGVSRRMAKWQQLRKAHRLPPAMLDHCPCGSGLRYEVCCGAR